MGKVIREKNKNLHRKQLFVDNHINILETKQQYLEQFTFLPEINTSFSAFYKVYIFG